MKDQNKILAVRAINDYRRRDVFGFIGTRLYLESKCSSYDHWISSQPVNFILKRNTPHYFCSDHFKEYSEDKGFEHRSIYVPAPNEILAETALLYECCKFNQYFLNHENVFSYKLNEISSKDGSFVHFVKGVQGRHDKIKNLCINSSNLTVLYTDIKKFYPSISCQKAHNAWERHTSNFNFTKIFKDVGYKLISDYSRISENNSILTGPMFSHLLANLVFSEIDEYLINTIPAKYFRYVDDITLVGSKSEVATSFDILRRKLIDHGFVLHDRDSVKTIQVDSSVWLNDSIEYTKFFGDKDWAKFIINLKVFLLKDKKNINNLYSLFKDNEIKIPIYDYSTLVQEEKFLNYFINWYNEFFSGHKKITHLDIAKNAILLGDKYFYRLKEYTGKFLNSSGFSKKVYLSILKYLTVRLIYLAKNEKLIQACGFIKDIPELFFNYNVMLAVATGEIDKILVMGPNAAQAAAQPIKASGRSATTRHTEFQRAKDQSLCVFLLNGVHVQYQPNEINSELRQFSEHGATLNLMKSNDGFIRELASLHGLSEKPRHQKFFTEPFDYDENLHFDAISQTQGSFS